jgi:hypothetical protein
MEIKYHGNDIIEIISKDILIKETNDIFNLFSINKCSTIIVKKENIIDEFYNLSTGIAGEILQKFSTYKKRMAIIGDFENIKSKALNDFIYESNKTKQIIFVKNIEKAIEIFK